MSAFCDPGAAHGDRQRAVEVRVVEEQHRELVAAESCSQVVGANAAVDALGNDPQEAVAGPVAQRVVHDLEVVEVEEQDDGIEPRVAGGELRIHLLGEHRPVRQPGGRPGGATAP